MRIEPALHRGDLAEHPVVGQGAIARPMLGHEPKRPAVGYAPQRRAQVDHQPARFAVVNPLAEIVQS